MKTLRRRAGVVAAIWAVMHMGSSALASEPTVLDRIVSSGEMRVALSGRQAPYNAMSRDGELIGLEVELARLLGEALGVNVVFVTRPFPSLLDALREGEADMVMSGMAITAQRNLKFAFAGPYLMSGKAILTKSETLAAAETASDLDKPELRLVALAGSTSQRFVERRLPQAQLKTTTNYDSAVLRVLDGHADALVADLPACRLAVLRFPEEGLLTLDSPLIVEPIGIALPASDPLLLNLIENYLNALESTGALGDLRRKWLEDGSWVKLLP